MIRVGISKQICRSLLYFFSLHILTLYLRLKNFKGVDEFFMWTNSTDFNIQFFFFLKVYSFKKYMMHKMSQFFANVAQTFIA